MKSVLLSATMISICLVLLMPVASAMQIRIVSSGPDLTPTYQPLVSVTSKETKVTAFSYDLRVNVTAAGTPAYPLIAAYVWWCKGDPDPATCTLQSFEPMPLIDGIATVTKSWSLVADTTGSYPQTAYILVGARLQHPDGTTMWATKIHKVVRTSASVQFTHQTLLDVDAVAVHAASVDAATQLSSYITSYRQLPLDPARVSKIVIQSASSITTLLSNTPPYNLVSQVVGNEIVSTGSNYVLLFPFVSGFRNAPVAVVQSSSGEVCGDNQCGNGEKGNCCSDCPCDSGSYCTYAETCSLIDYELEYVSPTTLVLPTCDSTSSLPITVRLKNLPVGASTPSFSAVLGGIPQQPVCVFQGNELYRCTLVVTPPASCGSGTVISGNTLTATFTHQTGSGKQYTTSLLTAIPTIQTGVCGNGICDTGEDATCCLDCGCTGGFECQLQGTTNGQCVQPFGTSNLVAVTVTPQSLLTHDPVAGTGLTVSASVLNPPEALTLGVAGCAAACQTTDGSCTASCTGTCSLGANATSLTCALNLKILNYQSGNGYTVSQTLALPFSYTTATGTTNKLISLAVPPVGFGQVTCGNGLCDPTESRGSCCYDCPCGTGEYCEAVNEYATLADTCQPDPELSLYLLSVSPGMFEDSSIQNKATIIGKIKEAPTSLTIERTDCGIQDTELVCSLDDCFLQGNILSCTLTLPVFPDDPTSPIFDRDQEAYRVFADLDVHATYHDGPQNVAVTLSTATPELLVGAVPVCGDGVCGTGESAATCCLDCSCIEDAAFGEGFLCVPGGSDPQSLCVKEGLIGLIVYHVTPEPVKCTLSMSDKTCHFLKSIKVDLKIVGLATALQVQDVSYTFQGNEHKANCAAGDSSNSLSCILGLPPLEKAKLGGQTEPLRFAVTALIPTSDEIVTGAALVTMEATHALQIKGIEDDIKSGDELANDLLEETGDTEDQGEEGGATNMVFQIITAIMSILCYWFCTPCCVLALIGGLASAAMQGNVLAFIGAIVGYFNPVVGLVLNVGSLAL